MMTKPEYLSSLNTVEILEHAFGFPVDKDGVEIPETPLDCVIVVVDVETNEISRELQIAEWGQYVLDTKDIRNIQVGDEGAELLAYAEARHYRVKEYGHLVNYRWCTGCPDKFLLGKSEWVSKIELLAMLHDRLSAAVDADGNPRLVLFVAHDKHLEEKALKQLLGDDYSEHSKRFIILDTQKMAASMGFGRQIGLPGLLQILSIDSTDLHNGGNDAFFEGVAAYKMACLSRARKARSRTTSDDTSATFGSTSNDSGTVSVTTLTTAVSTMTINTTSPMTLSEAVDAVVVNAKENPLPPTHGSNIYCTRCASSKHDAGACPYKGYQCTRCYAKGHLPVVCGMPDSVLEAQRAKNAEKMGEPQQCTKCGELGHWFKICHARYLKCGHCGRRGHAASVCFSEGLVSRSGRVYDGARGYTIGQS